MTSDKIKQLKKQRLTEDIKALFNQIDDVRYYTIRPAIGQITRKHFSNASDLFIYYVGMYALALYDLEQDKENVRLLKVVKNEEAYINMFIAKCKLTKFELLEDKELPF